jgi:hypothetical protein
MTAPGAFSLTRLFITPSSVPPDPTLAQDWVGGVMTQWDAVSFANTVVVGPVTYRNLPVVSPNGLTEGTVLLAKAPGGYIVIGMLGNSANITLIDPIRYRVLRSDLSLSSTTLVNAGTLNFLLNENTQYAVDGALFFTASAQCDVKFAWNGPPNMATKWSMNGIIDSSIKTFIDVTSLTAYGDTTTQTIWTYANVQDCMPKAWFATTDTPGLLQLRVAEGADAKALTLLQGSWLRITELGSTGGATTFIKAYPATGSRSYDKNGTFIGSTDGDNELYMGSFSGRSFGSERHMWTFDAATMRTDLTGATILSAQMALYCTRSDSAQGDYNWFWSTASTIQTTFPSGGFGGSDVQNIWTPGSWASFDISSEMHNILNSNANSVLGGPAGFSDASTGFHGFGFSASYRPYIQVTYAV